MSTATIGALWSSWTITVSPVSSTNLVYGMSGIGKSSFVAAGDVEARAAASEAVAGASGADGAPVAASGAAGTLNGGKALAPACTAMKLKTTVTTTNRPAIPVLSLNGFLSSGLSAAESYTKTPTNLIRKL